MMAHINIVLAQHARSNISLSEFHVYVYELHIITSRNDAVGAYYWVRHCVKNERTSLVPLATGCLAVCAQINETVYV